MFASTPLMARRDPPIVLSFGLFSALLAVLFMRALGTAELDPKSYETGVGLAAIAGVVTAWGARKLRSRPSHRGLSIVLVLGMGALVGVAIQWLLLVNSPPHHAYILSSGPTSAEPIPWVVVGAPLGALPALLAAGLLAIAERVLSRGALDARERLFFPFATASALLGAAALGLVGPHEKLIMGGVMGLALVALFEIAFEDFARTRWLRRLFDGEDCGYELVLIDDPREVYGLPAVVGGVAPYSIIMKSAANQDYRTPARTPLASTGMTVADALWPVRRRRLFVLGVIAFTLLRVAVLFV